MINDIEYTFCEIADAINGQLIGENGKVLALSTDSREVSSIPWCFFAIKGEKYNGRDYINQAISNGATLIVTEEKISYPVSVIYVENTRTALGLLSKRHKGKTKIIGVTGSYGKTTVKDMIISVLSESYSVTGTYENNNNEIGVAKTLLSIKKEDFGVVEMGMRGLGEIEWLSYIAEPEIAVITGCGQAHIGILGSEENIFCAKSEILKYAKKYAILPSEERFRELECKKFKNIYIGENGDYFAENTRAVSENKILFEVDGTEITLNSIYKHNVNNAVFAYAVGKLYGLNKNSIKIGLEKWRAREGRGTTEIIKGVEIIDDCYNASYESVVSAINTLGEYKKSGKRVAALLGDMRELGNEAKELHFQVGELCKKQKIDELFVFGEYANSYLLGYGGGVKCESFDNISNQILASLKDGYVLLVKASNASKFSEIIRNMREK